MRQIHAEYPNNLLYHVYFSLSFQWEVYQNCTTSYTIHGAPWQRCAHMLIQKSDDKYENLRRFTLYKHMNRLKQIFLVNFWRCAVSWLSRVLKQAIKWWQHWFLYHMQSCVRSYLDMSLFIVNTNCVNVGVIFLECNLAHALYLHQTCERGNGEKPQPACSILQLHKLSQNLQVHILCLKFKTIVPSTPMLLWRNIQDVLDQFVLYAITETGF